MELNSDFTRRAVVHAAQLEWVASPMAGVDRRMLDRIPRRTIAPVPSGAARSS